MITDFPNHQDNRSSDMQTSTCRLCWITFSPPTRNHLVPAFASRLLKASEDGDGQLHAIKVLSGEKFKRPDGLYEWGLLCEKCEGRTARWDDAGAKVLRQESNKWKLIEGPNADGISLWHVDPSAYTPIKLLGLVTLFRLHASTIHDASSINLGDRHRDRIAQLILSDNAGGVYDYPMMLIRLGESKIYRGAENCIQLFPRAMTEGRNFYKIDMAGFRFCIMVDNQMPTSEIRNNCLKPTEPSPVPEVPYDRTNSPHFAELAVRRNMAYVHPAKRQR